MHDMQKAIRQREIDSITGDGTEKPEISYNMPDVQLIGVNNLSSLNVTRRKRNKKK